jgi:hypothetical protein
VRPVALRPARFFPRREEGELPLEPPTDLEAAPISVTFYRGRVEAVAQDGSVTARLWEWPSGRELLAPLVVDDVDPRVTPQPGDGLKLWTWIEIPERSRVIERKLVKLLPHRLSEEDREDLRAFLASLEDEP